MFPIKVKFPPVFSRHLLFIVLTGITLFKGHHHRLPHHDISTSKLNKWSEIKAPTHIYMYLILNCSLKHAEYDDPLHFPNFVQNLELLFATKTLKLYT